MANQSIIGGTLTPVYINETATRQAMTPGGYINVIVAAAGSTITRWYYDLIIGGAK